MNDQYLLFNGKGWMERYIESFRCASIITNINRIVYLLDSLTEEDVLIDRDLDVPNWNIKLGRTPKTARNIFEHDPIRGNEGISSCIISKCVNLVFYYPPAMTTKETALIQIQSLITRFEEQQDSYRASEYNETLTRRDFIDPFFKALGWDIDNSQGYAEAYREVIHEDRVNVGGATKAPDYSFRLAGGKRLFFVEAKKPRVDVKNDIQPAYQVRRYGWSAKLPVSIITDFEEFAVYDCTRKPSPTDGAAVSRVRYLTWKDRPDGVPALRFNGGGDCDC